MELPDETLKLLREIRDSQPELLVFMQEWKTESDRRNRKRDMESEQDRKKYEAWQAEWEESNSLFKKAVEAALRSHEAYRQSNEEWLRGNKTVRTMALIFVAVFGAVLGIGGVLAALGWIG